MYPSGQSAPCMVVCIVHTHDFNIDLPGLGPWSHSMYQRLWPLCQTVLHPFVYFERQKEASLQTVSWPHAPEVQYYCLYLFVVGMGYSCISWQQLCFCMFIPTITRGLIVPFRNLKTFVKGALLFRKLYTDCEHHPVNSSSFHNCFSCT